jgi:23S rRNA (guanosine2251-2'-O)-methyltransferase
MIYGIHPVTRALEARRRLLRALYYKQGVADNAAVGEAVRLASGIGLDTFAVSGEELGRRAGSRQHQGLVLDCGDLPKLALREWLSKADPQPTLVALDQVEDPQNVGAIVRSADFLGASAVLLHRSHRAPLSAAASKASAGALEYFPVLEVGNLAQALRELKKRGFWIAGAAVDEDAKNYRQVELPPPRVLVMGSEGRGLRRLTRELCDEILFVPRRGRSDSLNVHVATTVILAQLMDQGLRAT